MQFDRRKSHASKQILILHFDGVIGNLILSSQAKTFATEEVALKVFLRHAAPEGLRELNEKFQVVLFSTLKESMTLDLLDSLQSQSIPITFDAVYCL